MLRATDFLVPLVQYESEAELLALCLGLLQAYCALTHHVVSARFRARRIGNSQAFMWTELDRLMLGISTFDEIVDGALPLVLTSTKGIGALYAHELNTRIMRIINKHNFMFFHETTRVCEVQLRASMEEMLRRVLLTGHNSHYSELLHANFKQCVAWDGAEWLACPRHREGEYAAAIRAACTQARFGLNEDLVLVLLTLLGVRG